MSGVIWCLRVHYLCWNKIIVLLKFSSIIQVFFKVWWRLDVLIFHLFQPRMWGIQKVRTVSSLKFGDSSFCLLQGVHTTGKTGKTGKQALF